MLTRLLLFFFAIQGLLHAFVIPPFQVPDEDVHWQIALSRLGMDCSPEVGLARAFPTATLKHNPGAKLSGFPWTLGSRPSPACSDAKIGYGNIAFRHYGP